VRSPDNRDLLDPHVEAELNDPDLGKVAEAILDGTPVDWTAAAVTGGTSANATLRQLRVLADVAAVHRCAPQFSAGAEAPSTLDAAAERTHWGPLTLRERIGSGAFGEVFRAWDSRLDREVALKLLRPDATRSDDRVTTSIEEGRLLARVRHPNVVQVYGAERIDGRVGLWTEFVRGCTLAEFVRQHGRLSAPEAIAFGIDVARALSAVHKAGLLHRDIKPQNVMREEGGRIVLMDLGAGRERVEATIGGANDLTGTPLYMAPELWRGAEATPRSDIYSLGVLLYYLATETHPVQGKSSADVQEAHAAGRRLLLRDERPDLPEAFIDVVERAIAPNPDARYESAGALEAALRRAHDAVAPQPSVTRGLLGPRRVALLAALAGVLPMSVVAANIGGIRDSLFGTPIRTLAVLPVANISADAAHDDFAAGLTEVLKARLGSIRSLEVRSPPSGGSPLNGHRTLADAATSLGVDAVLETKVTIDGDVLHLEVQLAQVAPANRLWSKPYTYQLPIALTLENALLRDLADQLHLTLMPAAQARLARERTVNPRAYQNVVRGRALSRKGTRAAREEALRLLLDAIALEPAWAEPRAQLALLYAHGGNYLSGGRSETRRAGRDAANDALRLDEWSAEAHTALGWINACEWDSTAAEKEFQLAIAANAYLAPTRAWYAQYLSAIGRDREAIKQADWGMRIAPDDPGPKVHGTYAYYMARRYDDAARFWNEALTLDPDSWSALSFMARLEIRLGRTEQAIDHAERAAAMRNGRTEPGAIELATVATAYAAAGRRDVALRAIQTLEDRFADGKPVGPLWIALPHLWLGNRERAMYWLWKGHDGRSDGMFTLNRDPLFDALRDSPDYVRLTNCIFFPREAVQANAVCGEAGPRAIGVSHPAAVSPIR
jgi:serine/threonine-protein kinase